MARRERPKKKGMNPVVAVLILLASVGFAAKSLMGTLGGEAAEFADLIGLGEGEDDPELFDTQEASEIAWRDLLAEYGSYDPGTPVRPAFSVMAASMPASPVGETSQRWIGDAPPSMRLGVVMVSEKSRRAVFGGAVVGVGESVAGGVVAAIEPGLLRLDWRQRSLTYDLDSEVPREFRAEHARRLEAQQEAAAVRDASAGTGVANEGQEAGAASVEGEKE